MAEKKTSPSNLWGKPLPANLQKLQTREPKMATEEYEEDFDAENADVDAELDDTEADATIDDDVDSDEANELAYAESSALEANNEPGEDDEEEDAYDSEAGDEEEVTVVDSTVETNAAEPDPDDSVVAEDIEQDVNETEKKKGSSVMKKRGSDYIRDEIARRTEAGESLRGVDIVSALAKKRVTVSAAQVSQLLKAAGVAGAPRGRQPAAKPEVSVQRPRPAAVVTETQSRAAAQRPKNLEYPTELPLDQLKAASLFLDACDGSYDTAAAILDVHRKVGSVMTR
jgi:hypothetical protein